MPISSTINTPTTLLARAKALLLLSSAMIAVTPAYAAHGEDTTAADQKTIETITVTADREESLSADYIQAGTFQDSSQRDTPLTIAVMTKELLDAQQARSVIDAVRNTPGVTQAQITSVIYSNLAIRGIPVDNVTNYRWNGVLPIINFIDQPIESKDRVEVLKGAAGLYYGFATPSGVVNLVSERASKKQSTTIELHGTAHGSYGVNLDTSQRFASLGVRLNAGTTSLENGVDRTSGKRHYVSGALDWQPTDSFTLLLDGEYIYKTITEPTEYYVLVGGLSIPDLQDPSKNLGAEWLQGKGHQSNLLARAEYVISNHLKASFAAGQSYLERERRYSSFYGYDLETGDGTLSLAMTSGNDYRNTVYKSDLSASFSTGLIDHEILVGASYTERNANIPAATRYAFSQNLYDPITVAPLPTPDRIIASTSRVKDKGLYIFEKASIGDWLQATIGYRKADYRESGSSENYKLTPDTWSYGLMVKPKDWLNIYANYIEGIEAGGIAQQITNNAGEVLPAALSKQKEIGIKVEPMPGFLVTAAYFHITRPSSYINSDNYYVQDGDAVYKGMEFSATGEMTPNLSVAVTASVLEAEQSSGDPAVVGKQIENTAKFSGSAFIKYRTPWIDGLSISAGIFRMGERAINALNQAFVPGYTTFDLGASYAVELWGRQHVLNIYGQNITGKRYWAAAGSSLLQQAAPSQISFSISTTF
ncbi:TonB-dependent siderophore receptor [Kordiimonas sp.]|uniref:TonB-dependent siderophore receptor n=1 Tax=Kordiimonas sp. TaxID=1970157 RepID=UPI003A8FE5C2